MKDEIITEPVRLKPGQVFTADEDGAVVFTDTHTLRDILRYVVVNIGVSETIMHLESMEASHEG